MGVKRYERAAERVDTRAGSYERKLRTKAGEVKLKVPRLRSLPFETQIIERYRRRESSVEEALMEMYLAGVSVRRVEDYSHERSDILNTPLFCQESTMSEHLYRRLRAPDWIDAGPGNFPWDTWERRAQDAGVWFELAVLGRSVYREAYQHNWEQELKQECGWQDDGNAMIDLASAAPSKLMNGGSTCSTLTAARRLRIAYLDHCYRRSCLR